VETTGKTVEEALDAALDQLGVDETDAEYEVVEESKTGLFGRLRSEARVRARVRPTTPRQKDDRRDRRRKSTKNATDSPAISDSAANGTAAAAPSAAAQVPADVQDSSEEVTAAASEARAQRPPRRPARSSSPDEGAPVSAYSDEEVSLNQQADIAEEFLDGLLDAFGYDASITTEELDEDTVEVRIVGGDLGLLIGPKGATLASIQELTRTVVQRKSGARTGRLLVDVSGYRQRRREALERFTTELAGQVVASGEPAVLEPMSAADRKVVHDTANGIDGVRTESQDEEPRRRVVILPEG